MTDDYREVLLGLKKELQKKGFQQKVILRRKNVVKTVKECRDSSACEICGESNPVILVFYHTVKKKKFSVTSNNEWRNKQVAKKELSQCRILCNNCYHKEYPEDYPPDFRRDRIRKWVNEKKAKIGCDCGEKDPRCLVLHRKETKRRFSISEVASKKMKKADILKRMDSYNVICFNCLGKAIRRAQIENRSVGE
jgi:hypothetical protein